MIYNCNCPGSASLPNIPVENCPVDFGQIQKLVFQRLASATGAKNKFTKTTSSPEKKASWTALLSASDSTKAVCSPFVYNPSVEPGGARTYGSDNAALNGIPRIIGADPTKFTMRLESVSGDVSAPIRSLYCEGSGLGVFLINGSGQIGMLADDPANPTEYYPIPMQSFFMSDRKLGGFSEPDSHNIEWSCAPGWSDNLVFVTPEDFNALTDLHV